MLWRMLEVYWILFEESIYVGLDQGKLCTPAEDFFMAISSTWSTVILGCSLGLDACMNERGDWIGVALAEGAAEEVLVGLEEGHDCSRCWFWFGVSDGVVGCLSWLLLLLVMRREKDEGMASIFIFDLPQHRVDMVSILGSFRWNKQNKQIHK